METLRVLFVCTDNTSRSRYAEEFTINCMTKFGAKASVQVEVKSAAVGAGAPEGALMTDEAIQACKDDFKLSKRTLTDKNARRSQRATPELAEWADVIIVMTLQQKEFMRGSKRGGPSSIPKTFTLTNYVGEIGDVTNLYEVLKFMRMVCQRFCTEGKETLLKPYRAPEAA